MPDDFIYRLIAFAGFCIFPCLAWLTGGCVRVDRKTMVGSLLLIWGIGILTFWLPWSRQLLSWLNDVLVAVLAASQKGTVFLFGPLALGPGQSLPDGTSSIGFILAVQILPSVIFFSALVSGLYYLNIMPRIVRFFARVFDRFLKLSGAESLSAAANIFVGIESSLTIRPYLKSMTRSELLTLLTCMMATVASTVMAVYVLALQNVFPQIAGHLLSASVISIPAAILISKLSLPETEVPETGSDLLQNVSPPVNESKTGNLITALIDGGTQGVKMAVGIATLLIIVFGLEAMADLVLGLVPFAGEGSLTLARILGWVAWPFTVLLGLRPEEWQVGAEILGSRFIEGEVPAYFRLAAEQAGEVATFSPRSLIVLTYALCGFVHLASMGIFVGGLAALVPERAADLSVLGLRALWTAFLATLLTGCVAGVLAH
jgi:CNT family concentrative nucleoside transporter